MPVRLAALLVGLVAAGSACRYHAPTQPDAVAFSETAPATLSVNATPGSGPEGGTASIVARVQNGHGTNLPGVRVSFTTNAGTLSTGSAETIADGTATLSLMAATAATITATAGTLTAHALVQSHPNVPTVTPIPDGPPPPPPGPPAPGPLTVTLLVTPGFTGSPTIFGLQAPGIARAVWTFGDGDSLTTTGGASSHSYAAPGAYTASVTITDTFGRTASNSQTFGISNPPPRIPGYDVTLLASRTSVGLDESATLTATAEPTNGAAPATSYAWDCNGDGTAEVTDGARTHVCTYAVSGTIASRVVATGGTATGAGAVSITVAESAPLFVHVTADGSLPMIGTTISFTGVVTSTRTIPSPLQWEWNFDTTATSPSTRTESGASPHPTTLSNGYGSSGVKTITVRVTDPVTARTAIGTTTVTVQ